MIDFLNDIFNELNSSSCYALFRNRDKVLAGNCRDVDLLIKRTHYKRFIPLFKAIIERHSFKIITIDDRQFMSFWGLARIIDDKIDIISFDFVFDVHVHDLSLLDTSEMLNRRELYDGIYTLRVDDEFITKYLPNRLLGAEYPAKYLHLQKLALERYRDDLDGVIKRVFGDKCSSFTALDSFNQKELMKLLRRRRFKTTGVCYLKERAIYLYMIAKRMINPAGITIAFTGADGVGKTTVIDMIISNLQKISDVTLFHHRPTVIGNIGDVAHKSGLKKDVDREYDKPHRGGKKGFVNSLLRLAYYTLDYIIGYWLKIRVKLLNGGFVIFDRYYNDVIVDSRRTSIYLPIKFLYAWGKLFIPKMQYNFLVTADVDVIRSRKQELDREGIERINRNMEYLSIKQNFYLVKNNETAHECLIKILYLIISRQHLINLKNN